MSADPKGVTVPGVSFLSDWEASVAKSDGQEYFEILATIVQTTNSIGPVADTLNCHHCLSLDDQRKIARLIAAAPDLLDFLRDSLASWTAAGPTDAPWEARMRALLALATKEAL